MLFPSYDACDRSHLIMKTKLLIPTFLLLTVGWVSSSEYREWTDRQGRSMEARLLEDYENGTIRIERSDGWIGNLQVKQLSDADREFVNLQRKLNQLQTAEPTLPMILKLGRYETPPRQGT